MIFIFVLFSKFYTYKKGFRRKKNTFTGEEIELDVIPCARRTDPKSESFI